MLSFWVFGKIAIQIIKFYTHIQTDALQTNYASKCNSAKWNDDKGKMLFTILILLCCFIPLPFLYHKIVLCLSVHLSFKMSLKTMQKLRDRMTSSIIRYAALYQLVFSVFFSVLVALQNMYCKNAFAKLKESNYFFK